MDIAKLGSALASIDGLKEGLFDDDGVWLVFGILVGWFGLSPIGLDEGLCDTDGWNVPTRVGDALGSREGNTDTLGTELGKYNGEGA